MPRVDFKSNLTPCAEQLGALSINMTQSTRFQDLASSASFRALKQSPMRRNVYMFPDPTAIVVEG